MSERNEEKPGVVWLVGAGPGDPGLLTLRAREVLERAEVVVCDALVPDAVLSHVPAGAEIHHLGKRGDSREEEGQRPSGEVQAEIEDLLVRRAREGKRVVRLKGGDPFVFGRGGEEALRLAAEGIPFEVVPGVTAATAAAAYAGISLTHRDLSSSVVLATGHEDPAKKSSLDWAALAAAETVAVYMGVRNLEEIAKGLLKRKPPSTPAALIAWGTTGRQRTLSATLGKIAEEARAAGIGPPAILVIGEVVALREKLRWFDRPEHRPLLGKRVLVTRARAGAGELSGRLFALGADCCELPVIRFAPPENPDDLKRAAERAATFAWILFTSGRGVEAFFAALTEAGLDARALGPAKVAAVGPGTARALDEHAIRPDLVPEKSLTSELAAELVRRGEAGGKRFLLPRAEEAGRELPETLHAAGASVEEVVAYRTLSAAPLAAEELKNILAESFDYVTATSGSTVRGLLAVLGADGVKRLCSAGARLVSIGPVTSAQARKAGLAVAVEAGEHTLDGLVAAILADARDK